MRVERIGDATLYLGDCLEVLPTLAGVDAVVTDPPYGVDLGHHAASKEKRAGWLAKQAYRSYEDTEANLLAVVVPAIQQALALAQRGLVFCAGRNAWLFPRADAIGGVFLPAGCGRNPWGFASFAHCLLYGKAPDLHLGAKPVGISSTSAAEHNGHPCPKPIEWMAWAVNLASRPGEVVLDPFMGSGTTGVACARMGRRFIGVEVDPGYFEIACRRIRDTYAQGDLFVPPPARPVQGDLLADPLAGHEAVALGTGGAR